MRHIQTQRMTLQGVSLGDTAFQNHIAKENQLKFLIEIFILWGKKLYRKGAREMTQQARALAARA